MLGKLISSRRHVAIGHRTPRYFRPMLEMLENRVLLSGGQEFVVRRLDGEVHSPVNSDDLSLPEAIILSNEDPLVPDAIPNTIKFALGPGTHSVSVLGSLPPLVYPVTIDGSIDDTTKQPAMVALAITHQGFQEDFYHFNSQIGIHVGAANCVLRGLVISDPAPYLGNFIGINLAVGPATVEHCYIGTDPNGAVPAVTTHANVTGIVVNSSGNTIGGLDADARNIISGNTLSGIYINGIDNPGIGANTMTGNFIGVTSDGTKACPNVVGILVVNSNNNKIGTGDTLRNVISGNLIANVELSGTSNGNLVQNNYIGTDPAGRKAMSAFAANGDGAVGVLVDGSTSNVIGGAFDKLRNVISGNAKGVLLQHGAFGNTIAGNYIGTDQNGAAAVANGVGVAILDSSNNFIIDGNVISGNQLPMPGVISGLPPTAGGGTPSSGQIVIQGFSTRNTVLNDYIGTDATGTKALADPTTGFFWGVLIDGADYNTIGGIVAADSSNVISGNSVGIQLQSGATNNQIIGNLIGTDKTDTFSIPNVDGVTVFDAPANYIGMRTYILDYVAGRTAGNVISGNHHEGIWIAGHGSDGNFVYDNYIGLRSLKDTQGLGNGDNGILIDGASGNEIGAHPNHTLNFIACNGGRGIVIQGGKSPDNPDGAVNNKVIGNWIGTNFIGSAGLGNTRDGILIAADKNQLENNLVAGNTGNGIVVLGPDASANQILYNGVGIGYDFSSAESDPIPLPNGENGVLIDDAAGTLIQLNLISANMHNGLVVAAGAAGTLVLGNDIGTGADGKAIFNAKNESLGNQGAGILIDGSTANIIGQGDAGDLANQDTNIISGNLDGILLQNHSTGNHVDGNLIGTNRNGTTAQPNIRGITIDNSNDNFIGANTNTRVARNLISSNLTDGVVIRRNSSGNHLEGNYIGTNLAGDGVIPRTNSPQHDGVVVDDSFNNWIGSPNPDGAFSNLT
jgi:Periplasmic copper-binding protein (NosD)